MLYILKKPKQESAYQCGYCYTIWKQSWLNKNQLDNTCPFCNKVLDIQNVTCLKRPADKSDYYTPLFIKLNLSVNKLESELKEYEFKSIDQHEDFQLLGTTNIKNKIFKLKEQIKYLTSWATKNNMDINDIYKWPRGTN